MRFSTTALVLGALAASEAAHVGKAHNHAIRHSEMMKSQSLKREIAKRDLNLLSALDIGRLTGLAGANSLGANPSAKTGSNSPWFGEDGDAVNEFRNESDEDLILVIWGVAGSWINAVQPQITTSIPKNSSRTVSFPNGWSGAWAPIYQNTQLVNGQISETWGEGTFNPPYSVVDVSREVNMNGQPMSIKGPNCVSDMSTCVFKCPAGQPSCMYGYSLDNCATGSQPGANFGTYDGAASGGCGGMGSNPKLTTTFGGSS